MSMASYPTTTFNGETFGVSSEPMPSRMVTGMETTGTARLMYKTASPYETKMLDFEKAILGWTKQDPINLDRLNRFFPHTWPLHTQGACNAVRMRLASAGRVADPDNVGSGTSNPSTVNNPSTDSYWPTSPFNLYDTDYGPLNYSRFKTDAAAYSGGSPPKELGRCILVTEQPQARELRVPDYGFVRADNGQPVTQIGFVPFVQSQVTYYWRQVPYPSCVPSQTIEDMLLKVNNANFDGNEVDFGWPAGTLLLRNVVNPDAYYFGPGGNKYVDVIFVFDYNPGGWNYYLLPSGSYVQLYKKGTIIPPYASADFTQLFIVNNP